MHSGISNLDFPPIDSVPQISQISSIEEVEAIEDILPYKNKYEMQDASRLERYARGDRRVITNIPDRELPSNQIKTSKYSFWTFIPLNLLVQFSKMANLYFLIVGYFETIDLISITNGQPIIWMPLTIVVSISALKDLFEDYKRHQSDKEENERKTLRLDKEGNFIEVDWQEIYVGDIIMVKDGEYFPADLALLGSSDPKGQCYIETKNLDGETNLKIKKVPRQILKLKDQIKSYENNMIFSYEKPNPYLYKFQGQITGEGIIQESGSGRLSETQSSIGNLSPNACPVTNHNFMLRGCSLRNTGHIIGVVAYTGHDSKVMLNSIQARNKSSHLEEIMNFFIITVCFIQIIICLFSAQYNSLWYQRHQEDIGYLEISEGDPEDSFFKNLFMKWGTWLLIFTNFIPISLLVTLEMVKFIQGLIIQKDDQCYSNQTPTVVQCSSLNEELGQVDYIFTDKTGTITRNVMEFKMMSINGKLYGQHESMRSAHHVEGVDFNDENFFKDLKGEAHQAQANLDFLLHMSICHSIIIVKNEFGQPTYNASSPDELALLQGAQFCGAEFLGQNEKGHLIVRFDGHYYTYEVLVNLEFSSSRKRMSMIIKQPDGKLILLIKGADTVLEKLLSPQSHHSKLCYQTMDHLEDMADKGLRTLMLCKREISEQEYDEWIIKYHQAQLALIDRDEKIALTYDLIEKNLEVIGATGIEDKLQADVCLTMKSIQDAGIKIWVLTGDKTETAINICYSCSLLSDYITMLIIDATTQVEVSFQIHQAKYRVNETRGQNFALVVCGDSLIHLLKQNMMPLMMYVTQRCRVVVCCRASPKQKQEIVSMVRKYEPERTTLAIGDGANDVNMITAAHIGIGIKGVEGSQAARAADYVIGEFKILRPLLFYYGRECYRRNINLVGYNFFKNLVIVLPQFWYSFNNGFSATNLYDPWLYQFYNLLYTSIPIVVYAVFDEQYRQNFLINKTQLYTVREYLSLNTFFIWFLMGALQSLIILQTCYPSFEEQALDISGHMQFMSGVGMAVFCYAIIVSNLKVWVFSYILTWASVLLLAWSILSLFFTYFILSQITVQLDISLSFFILIKSWHFWAALIIIITLTTLVDLAIFRYKEFSDQSIRQQTHDYQIIHEEESRYPSPKKNSLDVNQGSDKIIDDIFDDILEYQEFEEQARSNEMEIEEAKSSIMEQNLSPTPPLRRRNTRQYTGYCFSQQEKLIDQALKNAQN